MIIIIVKVTLPNRILSFKGRLKYLGVSSILRFFFGGDSTLRQKKRHSTKGRKTVEPVTKSLMPWRLFNTKLRHFSGETLLRGWHGEHRPYRSVPGKNWPPGFQFGLLTYCLTFLGETADQTCCNLLVLQKSRQFVSRVNCEMSVYLELICNTSPICVVNWLFTTDIVDHLTCWLQNYSPENEHGTRKWPICKRTASEADLHFYLSC